MTVSNDADLRNLKQGNQPLTLTQIKRHAEFAALGSSLKPRQSVGFAIMPAAGDAEKDRRFALRQGTI